MTRALLAAGFAVAFGAALYVPGLGAVPFYDKGEPREVLSLVAQRETGNWILPLTGGTTVPSKPPLLRWLGGLVVAATGRLDETAARLPSALLAVAAVTATAAAAALRFGVAAGIAAAIVLGTAWGWAPAAREARVDMALAACLTVSLLALERSCRTPGPPPRGALLVMYASAATAVLAKGPVGIAIPGLVGLLYLTARRNLGRLRHMRLVAGAAIVLVLAGGWYAAAAWQGGEAFVARQLGHENVARFLGGETRTSHGKPFYYYGPAFLLGFLPWTVLLVPAAVQIVMLRARLDACGLLFPLLWLAGVVGFYSLAAGKRSVYLLPAYPAAALVVSALFDPRLNGRTALGRSSAVLRAVVWLLVAALTTAVLGVLLAGADSGLVAEWLHPKDRRGLDAVIGLAREHAAATLAALGVLVGALAVVLVGLRRASPPVVLAGAGAIAVAVVLVAIHVVEPALGRERSLREFAGRVAARVPRDAELRFVGPPNGGMRFYLGRPLAMARRPVYQADDPLRCRYLLVWKSRWRRMRPEIRARLEPVLKSRGRGPEGNDRLLLARVPSPACGPPLAAAAHCTRRRPVRAEKA